MSSFSSENDQAREDNVLERIAQIVGQRNIPACEVHIGDDAAVLGPFLGQVVVSADVAVYGIHLDSELFSLEDLGFKAVTSALSDLAAMGAHPRGLTVSVSAPPGTDLEVLHRGISLASEASDCPVVGGDLSGATDTSVAVSVIGEVPRGEAVLRTGAKSGDEIFVTGPLGSASAGLRLRRGGASLDNELVTAQRRPLARINEGIAARESGVSAMMDLSDGIGLDLHRLASASNVGFALDQVPIADGATLQEAISGGEDYELLITTSDPEKLRSTFLQRGLREPISIGTIVSDPASRTLEGQDFEKLGWQHQL
jgi:thiamine-monophosphate kinase